MTIITHEVWIESNMLDVVDLGHGAANPVVIAFGSIRVQMTHAEAIALSRLLRVACGVEEPKVEEAA